MNESGTKAQNGVDVWITHHLPEIYVGIAFVLTIALCLLTPPFFIPDEISHASREIQIGHGGLIGKQFPEGVGGLVDANAKQVMDGMVVIQGKIKQLYPNRFQRPDGRVTEAQLAQFREIRWAHRLVFVDFQNTAVYPPFFYIPQAAGWRMGEAANLTILHTLLLARFLAAMSAIAIGWLAMRLCASGRWLLFAYLLLPTVLGLNASCSQDALLLPVAGLVMALLSRAIFARRFFTTLELVTVTGLLLVCIAARPPYLPLALLLFLPSLAFRGATWRHFVPATLSILVIVGALGSWELMAHPLGTPTLPLANPALQLAFLRAHPLRGAMNIPIWVVFQTPFMIPESMEVLGVLDVFPPLPVYALLTIGLIGIALFAPTEEQAPWRGRGTLIFVMIAVCCALSLAEYIIFTPPGATLVLGLQARYYLPLVPLSFLLFRHNPPGCKKAVQGLPTLRMQGRQRGILLIFTGLVFLSGVLYTPWVAAHRFYDLGLIAAFHATALR